MNIFTRKNAPLIIGFSLPIMMILFVAASIYLPGFFIKPHYNFLYAGASDYETVQWYRIEQNHLVEKPASTNTNSIYSSKNSPKLYVHDVMTDESHAISFEEAQGLNLDSSLESPDGFRLEYGSSSNGSFPFFWYTGSGTSQYLLGHNVSKRLNMKTSNSYYGSVHFIGWILED